MRVWFCEKPCEFVSWGGAKKSEGKKREARYVWLALLMTNKHASIKKYVDVLSRFVVAELVSKSHAAFWSWTTTPGYIAAGFGPHIARDVRKPGRSFSTGVEIACSIFDLERHLRRVTSRLDYASAWRLIQARMRCSTSGTMPGDVHSNTILIQLAREICFVLHL